MLDGAIGNLASYPLFVFHVRGQKVLNKDSELNNQVFLCSLFYDWAVPNFDKVIVALLGKDVSHVWVEPLLSWYCGCFFLILLNYDYVSVNLCMDCVTISWVPLHTHMTSYIVHCIASLCYIVIYLVSSAHSSSSMARIDCRNLMVSAACFNLPGSYSAKIYFSWRIAVEWRIVVDVPNVFWSISKFFMTHLLQLQIFRLISNYSKEYLHITELLEQIESDQRIRCTLSTSWSRYWI